MTLTNENKGLGSSSGLLNGGVAQQKHQTSQMLHHEIKELKGMVDNALRTMREQFMEPSQGLRA